MKSEEEYFKPEQFGLSNEDCRHKKVIDMLDENGIKPLNVLKDDPGFAKLNGSAYSDSKLLSKSLVAGTTFR